MMTGLLIVVVGTKQHGPRTHDEHDTHGLCRDCAYNSTGAPISKRGPAKRRVVSPRHSFALVRLGANVTAARHINCGPLFSLSFLSLYVPGIASAQQEWVERCALPVVEAGDHLVGNYLTETGGSLDKRAVFQKMARKGKKKRGDKKPTPKLTSMSDVVAKATTSGKLMRLWQDTILRDEVIDLKQRLEKAQGERDSLQKRATEREDQQEAVFDTLKDRVVVAQTEIQVNMICGIIYKYEVPGIDYAHTILTRVCPSRSVVAWVVHY